MFNFLKNTAYILVLVGALNRESVGIFNFDLVGFLFGQMSILTRIVYGLVGISAIYLALTSKACDRIAYENPTSM